MKNILLISLLILVSCSRNDFDRSDKFEPKPNYIIRTADKVYEVVIYEKQGNCVKFQTKSCGCFGTSKKLSTVEVCGNYTIEQIAR